MAQQYGYGNLAALQAAAAAQAARANTMAHAGGASRAQLLAAAAAQRAAQARMGLVAGGGVSQVAQLQAQARLQAQAAQARVAAAQQAAAAQAARLMPRHGTSAAAAAAAAAAARQAAAKAATPQTVAPPVKTKLPGIQLPNKMSSSSAQKSSSGAASTFEALLPAGSAGAKAGGTADFVQISTCHHKDISAIVAGLYVKYDVNHGKPVFKREPESKREKFEPLLYFWDKRDGEDNSGWWMGPKVGGDQVWAHHPKDVGQLPPEYGWVIPFSEGEVDPTFSVRPTPDGPKGKVDAGMKKKEDEEKTDGKNKRGRSKDKRGDRSRSRRRSWGDEKKSRRRDDDGEAYWEKQQEAKRLRESEQWEKTVEEKRAAANVARAIQKMYGAKQETYEELAKELMETLDKEMDALGSEKERVKVEAERSLKIANDRIQQLEEQKRKMQERLQKAKEEEEKLNKLAEELTEIVEAAEASTETIKETVGNLKTDGVKLEEFTGQLKNIEELGTAARKKHQAVGEFVKEKAIQVMCQRAGVSNEVKLNVQGLMKRLSESSNTSKTLVRDAQSQKETVISRLVATRRTERQKELFDKYDIDHDGVWTAMDLTAYAKKEFDFELPSEVIYKSFNPLVQAGDIGVSKNRFHQLLAIVGIARDAARQSLLRAEREERESKEREVKEKRQKQLDSIRTEMEERVNDAAKVGQAVEESVSEAEQKAKSIISFKEAQRMDVEDLKLLIEEVDHLLSSSRERLPDIRAAAKNFQDMTVEPELEDDKTNKHRMLHAAMVQIDNRVNRVQAVLNNGRVIVAKRFNLQFEKLRAVVVSAIREYMLLERLSAEALFDHKSRESLNNNFLDEEQWVALLREVGSGTDDADLRRLFGNLTKDSESRLPKEVFLRLMRVYNKVVYPSVITSGLCIGTSKVERRLEVNEVVEVLEGPEPDEESGVQRVFGRAIIDGQEGWMTVAGNQGTVYLEEGGNLYKVIHEVKLTDGLSSDKELRTLRIGEIFEMFDPPQEDDRSDTVRLHGRAKDDGQCGWVTLLDANRENLEML